MCDTHRAGTGTGSESFIFAIRIQKFLLGFAAEANIPVRSVIYETDYADSGSTPQPKCLSLNKRRLPRLAAPGETLGQRINLIVVPARKRQQLRNKLF
jgi:hypothetical protein